MEKICPECKGVFCTNNSVQKCCSVKCAALYKTQEIKYKSCLFCDKRFRRRENEMPFNFEKRKFCSRECFNISRLPEDKEKFCEYCNKKLIRKIRESTFKNRKFCDQTCCYKSQEIEINTNRKCEYCNEKLIQKENEKNHVFNGRRFCNQICSNTFTKEKRWKEEKESDTFKCVVCEQILSKSEFWKSKKIARGHVGACKECSKKSPGYNYVAEVKTEGKRMCLICDTEKDLHCFEKGQRYKYGRSSECRECKNKRLKIKRKTDINYRMRCLLRSRIKCVVKNGYQSKKSLELLGCSIEKFKTHFESKFTEGMTWDKVMNSEIHIDHIQPCCSFDLSKPEEQEKCFHYTNLQPLWAKDNLKKSGKLNWTYQIKENYGN